MNGVLAALSLAPSTPPATSTGSDWFKVALDHTKTYCIKIRGSEFSGGTLEDPNLRVLIEGGQNRASNNDKSATEKDSEVTFSPQETDKTEEYFIKAGTASTGSGTYTIELEEVT